MADDDRIDGDWWPQQVRDSWFSRYHLERWVYLQYTWMPILDPVIMPLTVMSLLITGVTAHLRSLSVLPIQTDAGSVCRSEPRGLTLSTRRAAAQRLLQLAGGLPAVRRPTSRIYSIIIQLASWTNNKYIIGKYCRRLFQRHTNIRIHR